MNMVLPLNERRIRLIGLYLAEFALEFVPGDGDMNTWDAEDFLLLFDVWYENFIRYVETNRLITSHEIQTLAENRDELDHFIKEAAIEVAREIISEIAASL